jgi:hypothetical protein
MNAFWVGPELLNGVPESERSNRVGALLRPSFGRNEAVDRIEPIFDNEHEIRGYFVYTRTRR